MAFDQIGLPAKSVNAYRKAEEMGETLAMSNLASKLIGTGFLPEAQKICDEALKLEDIHKNVGKTLGRLKEVPEEEDKKETDAIEKVRPISEFYKQFGRAIAMPTPNTLATAWQGPDCNLSVTFLGSAFRALGTYEVSATRGLLAGLLGSDDALSKTNRAPTRYVIEYQGTARGRAIEASVVRRREDEQVKMPSLLNSGEENPTVLMLINDNGNEIRVLEKAKNSSPRFYRFTCK